MGTLIRNGILFAAAIVACFWIPIQAQKTKKPTKPPGAAEVSVTPEPTPILKKNARPVNDSSSSTKLDPIASDADYRYEFEHPRFIIANIVILHDENGRGSISFKKDGLDDAISDPLQVSSAALERIKDALTALNFVNSVENYQYQKDYSHLGNVAITVRTGDKSRTAKYNWTENKHARILAEEYRKLGNQYIWMFDVSVARENQPLETPKLMRGLESLIRRNEVSDPGQMLPFLQLLSDDERMPLIARNQAKKLINRIEKLNKQDERRVN
ncbi:MAG: hypothetical protein WBD22_13560 [Pyrinomonadaceae bacterium]